MRRILLAAGALAAVALLAFGITRSIDAAGAISSTRIGDTRTPLPGTRAVDLDGGKHTVFYEVEDGSGDEEIDVPPLDLTIRPEGGGAPLELDGFSGDLDISSGGRAATAVRTVRVPEDGRYRIRVTGRADAALPAVVLGRPITGRVLRLLLAIAAVVAGLGLGALVLASAIALRSRDASQART